MHLDLILNPLALQCKIGSFCVICCGWPVCWVSVTLACDINESFDQTVYRQDGVEQGFQVQKMDAT